MPFNWKKNAPGGRSEQSKMPVMPRMELPSSFSFSFLFGNTSKGHSRQLYTDFEIRTSIDAVTVGVTTLKKTHTYLHNTQGKIGDYPAQMISNRCISSFLGRHWFKSLLNNLVRYLRFLPGNGLRIITLTCLNKVCQLPVYWSVTQCSELG